MNIRYERLPEHMRDGMRLYVEHGVDPGSFVYAVLCNKLVEAFGAADSINRARMYDWANFMYNEMPIGSWGSKEAVSQWISIHSGMEIPS